MITKKTGALFFVILTTLMLISFISAELNIKETAISSHAVKDMNLPAIFDLEITNLGATDSFNIYSIAGVTIEPNESFSINQGEKITKTIKIYPTFPLKVSPDYYSFEYKIKGENSGLTIENLAISVAYLKDSFNFQVDALNPESTKAIIHFDNKYGGDLNNLKVKFTSPFFSETKEFSLTANEKIAFEIPLNLDVLRSSLAGPYIVNAEVTLGDISGTSSATVQFEEKPGIETKETKEGIFYKRQEIEKINKGNIETTVEIFAKRNWFSSLFTGISPTPTNKAMKGFTKEYLFQEELLPGETLKVVITTNWYILIALILAIIIIWYLIDNYIRNKITMQKTVSFVRTKGGEFALRVNIRLKARDFVERIRVLDRLPPMVKVFEKYGISPDKIDEKNRRLEWNIQALSKGEERNFSYIVYSKVGVVGKFELPSAEAIYEFNGKIKETSSNSAVFEKN